MSRPRKVLLVERDLPSAHELAKLLAPLGIEAEIVRDTPAAAARLGVQQFAAIFSDVINPRMTGPQLMQVARSVRPAVPVILLTGAVHPRDLVRAYRMGVFDCLFKPVGRTELEEVVNRLPSITGFGEGLPAQETLPQPSFSSPSAGPESLAPSPTLAGVAPTRSPITSPITVVEPSVVPTGPIPNEGPLRARLERHIERDPLDLPIPAQLIRRLVELQGDSDPAADDVAALLQSSAPLSASIIRAARAADVSRASMTNISLQEALIRLGTNRALRTALTTASQSMSQDLLRHHPEAVHDLWLHHLVAARAAEHLSRELLPTVSATIHTWALFMEVGELVVLRAIEALAPELLVQAPERANSPEGPYRRETKEFVAELHGQAGRVAMRRWQLPPVFAELAMAHTHEVAPNRPPANSQKLVLILRASNLLASKLIARPSLTAIHNLTAAERAGFPEMDDALLQRAGRQALEDAHQMVAQSRGA